MIAEDPYPYDTLCGYCGGEFASDEYIDTFSDDDGIPYCCESCYMASLQEA